MIFVPWIIVIVFAFVFAPLTSSGKRRRRKPKGFIASMFEAQARTERKNSSHRGVMSSSSRVGARGGKRRR